MLLLGLLLTFIFFAVDEGEDSLTGPQWIVGILALIVNGIVVYEQFTKED